jgi:UDP-N-acetylglucosamine 2-epimerase (non-hydrolysing)
MSKTAQIACIVGARPNFVKMAPLLAEIRRRPSLSGRLIHTGQHSSSEMSDSFFRDLELPRPDEFLNVPPGTQTQQTAGIMVALERSFLETRPDLVIVVGDVSSTVATALVASKLSIPLAHVEAGLRSFDRSMPEEINRLVTDALADMLFVSEPSGVQNLRAEGVSEERIIFAGNVMIDTLLRFLPRARETGVLARLGVDPKSYVAVTLHRPANVDDPSRLRDLVKMLGKLAREVPVVFPVHPRTQQRMQDFGLEAPGLIITPPLPYLEFLCLMSEARLMVTDSGGIQEETTILGVPCLTARENTERPITIEMGTNRLVGVEPENILRAINKALETQLTEFRTPELWDGKAGTRIVDVIERRLAAGREAGPKC